ncbi:glycosyltransferase [Acidithiobacillus ferrivorans]|uniref:Glycosyltransferase n=1 Tax=Acidithiobacillus ferrivorans TaxID=160808 RepID=A0A7T5BHL6_9PROT|nr:glycosyltransferase [Acidithiobacillus ferrivorans]QQD72743.1 glycosyltransferase [Acidithiobacillus ferrivorans]
MKLVSVIVRSTNRIYLKDAIESISNQTYKNIEIIIVDASGTGEIGNRELESNRKIEVVCTGESLIRPKAANAGLLAAKGDELVFLDDDDIFYESHIEKLIGARSEYPEKLAAYSDVEVIGKDLKKIIVYGCEWSKNRLLLANYIPINSVLFSRKILDFGCAFDENLYILEDWDWWLQVANYTSFNHIPGVSACYRYELGESNHSRLYKEWRFILYKKWIGILGVDRFIEESFEWAQQADSMRQEKSLLLDEAKQRDIYIDTLRHCIGSLETERDSNRQEKSLLLDEAKQRDIYIDTLHHRIGSLATERDSMLQSWSWRVTQPLRNASRAARLARKLSRRINRQSLWRALQLARQGNWRGLHHRMRRLLVTETVEQIAVVSSDQNITSDWSTLSTCIIDNTPSFECHLPVTIIVPVYNGWEHLPAFFNSLLQNTTEPYVLLVINDASPDERVVPFLLKQQERFPQMSLLTNTSNLGFVRSVNRGMQEANDDVVLLNTDTIVPSYWLERLLEPLYDEKVASVTPFTNAGTICSFPRTLEDNAPIYGLSVDSIDMAFKRLVYQSIDIPTAVGFCMAISRRALNHVGYFDAEAFGRGYGEENDWCMRAANSGYRHVLCPNLYVYHAHGGSFLPAEKQDLLASNLRILDQRYPDYGNFVQAHIQKNPAQFYREAARLLLMLRPENRPALVIDHNRGGGANHFRSRFVQKCLDDSRAVCVYAEDYLLGIRQITCHADGDSLSLNVPDLDAFSEFMRKFSFDEVYYNSLVFASDPLATVDRLRHLPEQTRFIVNMHDFYPLCPSYTLLDDQDNFCGVPDEDRCKVCIRRHSAIFPNAPRDIVVWRNHWRELLERANSIRCFSVDSAQHMKRAYPECSEKIFVFQHDTSYFKPVPLSPAFDGPLHIGIIGGINKQKGAKILQNFASYVEKHQLPCQITLVGEIDPDYKLPDLVTVTGRYTSDDLPQIIIETGIQIVWFPSIWPETFSYVTAECMAMDLPITAFDIGAPAERLKTYHKSFIHNSKLPEDLYLDFTTFRERLLDYPIISKTNV